MASRNWSRCRTQKFNQLNRSGTVALAAPRWSYVWRWGAGASGKCQGHEARAEQHQAARGQCQETIGYEVMVAHGTPAALVYDARSDPSKSSERAVLKEVTLAARANAFRPSCGNPRTHGPGRSPRLPDPSVPKPSRSSLNSNPPLRAEKTRAALHSQKNFGERRDNGGGVRIWRNSLSSGGTEQGAQVP